MSVLQRLSVTCVVLILLHASPASFAQFTDPRTYTNTPVGLNQIEVAYTHVHANASLDTSLTVTGATVNLDQGSIAYTRYFSFLHRLTWLEAGLPVAALDGSIAGARVRQSIAGLGDSSYSAAMLLKGGPALSVAQFEGYKPTTTVGISLAITAPTGGYDANRILNLGSDRWSIKPEVGLSHPFGSEQNWQFDAHANVGFYTDNSSYHGRETLRQQPLPGFEGHITYSFDSRLWASLDTRYSFRGRTFVDNVDQSNPQQNLILGSEINFSLNARNSLIIEFAKAVLHQNGPALVGFSVRYDYTWGKGI